MYLLERINKNEIYILKEFQSPLTQNIKIINLRFFYILLILSFLQYEN